MSTAAPHVMVLPLPAQGHVTPLMELSHRLVDHGFKVTFVCTEPVHDALRQTTVHNNDGIHLVSIPDGLADGDDRRDLGKVLDALSRCVPGCVEDLIRETKVKWLVAGVSKAWLDEFDTRVAGRGMVVGWCSQQQVLAHRAVACFVSHCGWNSTMEGVRNGVPFLCWSTLKVDQYANRSYVCDIWRTGLVLSSGEDGVVNKEVVSAGVEQLVGDHGIAQRARVLGDAAGRSLGEGGSSYENFDRFVRLLRD